MRLYSTSGDLVSRFDDAPTRAQIIEELSNTFQSFFCLSRSKISQMSGQIRGDKAPHVLTTTKSVRHQQGMVALANSVEALVRRAIS